MGRTIAAFAFLLFVPAAAAQERILFEGPKDATKDDLEKATRAIQARCETVGYVGVKTEVVGNAGAHLVQLQCKTGFTEDMVKRVALLCVRPAIKSEIRWHYKMSDAEREQFRPAKNPAQSTAPSGGKWYYVTQDYAENRDFGYLIIEKPSIDWKQVSRLKERASPLSSADKEYFFELSKTATKALRGFKFTEKHGTAVLMIDDLKILEITVRMSDTEEGFGNVFDEKPLEQARVKITDRQEARMLDAILKTPLPFALSLRK